MFSLRNLRQRFLWWWRLRRFDPQARRLIVWQMRAAGFPEQLAEEMTTWMTAIGYNRRLEAGIAVNTRDADDTSWYRLGLLHTNPPMALYVNEQRDFFMRPLEEDATKEDNDANRGSDP